MFCSYKCVFQKIPEDFSRGNEQGERDPIFTSLVEWLSSNDSGNWTTMMHYKTILSLLNCYFKSKNKEAVAARSTVKNVTLLFLPASYYSSSF